MVHWLIETFSCSSKKIALITELMWLSAANQNSRACRFQWKCLIGMKFGTESTVENISRRDCTKPWHKQPKGGATDLSDFI